MNRVIVVITIFFMTGIFVTSFLNMSPAVTFVLLFLFLMFSIVAYLKKWLFFKYIIGTAFFLSGFLYGHVALYEVSGNSLAGLENNILVLEGIVKGDNIFDDDKTYFTIDTYRVFIYDKHYNISQKVRVRVEGKKEVFTGERVILKGLLLLPSDRRNPGEFSYRDYLLREDIHNIIHVNSFDDIKVLDYVSGDSLSRYAAMVRRKSVFIISELIPGQEGSLLAGMIFGTRSSAGDELIKKFQSTGTLHILAASGSNISILLVMIVCAGEILKISRRKSAIICIPVVIFYAFLAGGEPSIMRASVMSIVVLAGLIIEKEPDLLTSVFASAFLLLIMNPLGLYDTGFLLSFSSVLGIICFTPPLQKIFSFIPFRDVRNCLSVSLAAQLGVAPIVVYYFNELSPVAVFANLMIFMFVAFALVTGVFMLLVYPLSSFCAIILARISGVLVDYIIFIVNFLSEVPFASVNLPSPSAGFILFYYVFICFIFSLVQNYRQWRDYVEEKFGFVLTGGRIILIISIISLLFIWYPVVFPSPLKVVFLDVGQGDSIFIKLPEGKCFLVDGGKADNYYDTGKRVIIPFLKRHGIRQIDGIFLTHADNDHLGGLIEVLKNVRVMAIYDGLDVDHKNRMYREFLYLACKKGINYYRLSEGNKLYFHEGVTFEVLNPSIPLIYSENHLNENSLVLRIYWKKISLLLTGDIEKKGEERVMLNSSECQILKVSHHGSNTGTSREFLQKIKPEVAVISVGKKNPYGHPSGYVIERLNIFSGALYRTDYCGAITVISDGNDYKVLTVKNLKDRSDYNEIHHY
ncbi:MAG: DNA internalization-related competence protein ComEC/Rec2 [Candidatus Eremiobacterota bacterium]